ncbi:MAG: serine hydrolase [Acidobacteriota bacterium]|nr:serine hydrolase [Acidobacteriota bacterium]
MRLTLKLSKKLVFGLTATLILSSAFFCFISSSRAQIVNRGSANGIASQQKYRATIEMLDVFVRREMEDKQLPGISVALVDGSQMVWQQGYGFSDRKAKTPITADTVFRVGSVSKLFTDIAVMRLVEQGKLDLDAPVTNYLPDFKPRNAFGKFVTLRQLMSHRAGLVREPPVGSYFDSSNPTLGETIKSLNQTALVYAPETRTKYSNAGIAAVGYVLEKTQKQLFADYLKSTLLEPLEMKQSDFKPTPKITKKLARAQMWTVFGKTFDAPVFELGIAPAGSMYTTTGDLARFASALFAADNNSPGAILEKASLEQMWTPQFAAPDQKSGFGLGFSLSELEGHRKVGHGGAIYGFSTQFSVLPDDKFGVIVVATEDFSNGVTSRIADTALKAMLAERENKSIPQPEITSPIDSDFAKKIAGRYTSGDKAFDLIERGDNLSILNVNGGFEARLRFLGEALMVDDKFAFGTRIVPSSDGNSITVGNETFKRIPTGKPASVPDKWRGLIGEYGPDYDILYVFERDGKLWTLIEQFEFDPLEQVSDNIFKFPNRGLYDGEQLVFTRDANGRATQVVAANVTFKRRQVGPEEGAQQLRIQPLRPVSELLKEALAAQPPKETGDFRPTDLVELTKLDPTIKLEIRYATTNNFLGAVFYSQARAFLQRPAAESVARVNRKLREQGYGLLVHDAYRPWYVTKVFWDATPDDKKLFVADPSQGSRHNRGAAVDLTLYDLKTGKPVEMVGTYDETTDRSYPNYPGGTDLQRWHRELLRDTMESEGFTVYEAEWWHFDYQDWRSYRIGNVRFEDIVQKKGR